MTIEKNIELEPAIENILKQRYYQPEEDWSDLCMRVAGDLSANDKEMEEFWQALYNRDLLPNSPTLMNAGTGSGNYSACYVLPIYDDMRSIMKTASDTVMIHKYGGGTGFDFSRLRPINATVAGTQQTASGPVSFMKMINDITEQVKQGGKRRGANMAILRIDHPDILKFIRCKHDETFLVNFNISVAMTDDFISQQENNTDAWICRFEDDRYYLKEDGEHYFLPQAENAPDDALTANQIWNIITESAWKSGDPGIVFIDRVNAGNPLNYLGEDFEIRATNPCGEQPLVDYGSCNLVAVNLSNVVNERKIDYKALRKNIKIAAKMAEAVIERNIYPVSEVEEYSRAHRNIGVGLMGFHDMLLKLGIRYDTEEARNLAEEMMKEIYMRTFEVSVANAKKDGHFVGWSYKDYKLLVDIEEFSAKVQKDYEAYGLRNCCLTTIAPTGSIGLIAGCSTGIEPHFADKIYRRDATNPDGYWVVNPVIEEARNTFGEDVFVSAQDLGYKDHVHMQAAAQKYCDSGISKTINLPNEATIEDVENCYKEALMTGCKGITIYRDGCKTWQVLSSSAEEKTESANDPSPVEIPDKVEAYRYKVKDPESGYSVYVIISHLNGKPVELFATSPNLSPLRRELWDSLTRQISLNLRYNIPLDHIVEQLDKSKSIMSGLPAVLSRILKDNFSTLNIEVNLVCPSCDARSYVAEGGCGVCKECGFSECS